MSLVNVRPKWWLLYLTFPLLIALFILEERLKLSAGMHQALQIGIVFLVYGMIHWWLKANARALSNLEQTQLHESVIIHRASPRRLPRTRPMFVFPDAEIKGTLSDTFEMDVIDAEFLPSMDSVTDLKKE